MGDSDDEEIALSSNALAALQQFYEERDAHVKKFERLKAGSEALPPGQLQDAADSTGPLEMEQQQGEPPQLSMDAFTEDWNKSQFWYDDKTATLLAEQLLDGAKEDDVIAIVSAPSVFVALKNVLAAAGEKTPRPKVYLLEHDDRFSVFPEFVFYDFKQPFKLPGHLKSKVDRMIIDPPFLSEDCQIKFATTTRYLIRPGAVVSQNGNDRPSSSNGGTAASPRLIICTGERMAPLVKKLHGAALGVKKTSFEPGHNGGLQNEFCCYANYECEAWSWVED